MRKTLLMIIIFCLFAASVFAVGDEKYLQLVSNTAFCTDCETEYIVDAADTSVTVGCDGLQFKETAVDSLKVKEDISYLSNVGFFKNNSVSFVSKTCTEYVSTQNGANITKAPQDYECGAYEDVYVPLACPFTVPAGETLKIKVTGQLERSQVVDNVITLTINGDKEVYDQWVLWNGTVPYVQYKFENDGLDSGTFGYNLTLTNVAFNPANRKDGTYSLYQDHVNDSMVKLNTNIGGSTGQFAFAGWFYFSSGNSGGPKLFSMGNDDVAYQEVALMWEAATGKVWIVDNGVSQYDSGFVVGTGGWTHLTFGRNASDVFYVIENVTLPGERRFQQVFSKTIGGNNDINIGSETDSEGAAIKGYIDNVFLLNKTPSGTEFADMVAVSIQINIIQSTYNVTSASGNGSVWRVDTSMTVNTTTPTPTMKFSTTSAGNCSLGLNNWNYTHMVAADSTTNCGTVNTTEFNCTLPATQALSGGAQSVYVACIDTVLGETGNTSTSGALSITLLSEGVEALARAIIEAAGNAILGNPTIYTDQQIYVRRLNGSQQLATFDKVFVSGQQRWAFNYLTGSDAYQSMGNLTPVLYSYETTNISTPQLQSEIEALITSTRN